MESEERAAEETHPDEPSGNGEQPSEGEYEGDHRDDPVPPDESRPAEDLVERTPQGPIHDATSKRNLPRRP